MNIVKISLDVNVNSIKTALIKQYNTDSQQILITITENGEIFQINNSKYYCAFKMITPDNRYIYNECTINDDGTVSIDIDKNISIYPGKGTAEIDIIDFEGAVLCSMNFTIVIVKSAFEDEQAIGTNEFKILSDSVVEAKKYVREAEGWAHGRDDMPERETDNAKYYSDQSQTYLNTVKELAQTVENDKNQVSADKENVEDLVAQANTASTNAQNYSEQAKNYSDNAQSYAGQANTSSNNAESFASQANTSASEAKTAATQTSSDKEAITDLVAEVNNNLESMESLLENTPYTTVESEGEFELPVHTINDSEISAYSTWSSKKIIDAIYPIGSIYMSVNNVNPSELFGGTWVAWGSGRVPVGVNTSDSNFNTVEKTGGEKTHKLTVSEMPSHSHSVSGSTNTTGAHTHGTGSNNFWIGSDTNNIASGTSTGRTTISKTASDGAHSHTVSGTADATGGGGAHNNLQPYITCYMWKRTA